MTFSEVIDQLVQRLAAANGSQSHRAELAVAPAVEAREPERVPPEPPPSAPVLAGDDAPARRTLERATEAAESLNLGLHLGSAVMRIATAANAGADGAQSLREAVWLIERYIELLDVRPLGADIDAERRRLAHVDETIARLRALSAAMAGDAGRTPASTEAEERPAVVEKVAVAVAAEPPVASMSLGREIAFMAARWAVIVVSVIVVVLAVTLIADLR